MLEQWGSPLPLCRRDLRLVSLKLICITSQYVQNDALHCIAKCPLLAFFSICASSPQLISSPLLSFVWGTLRSVLYCKLFHEGFNIHVVGFEIGIDFQLQHGITSELVLAFACGHPKTLMSLLST